VPVVSKKFLNTRITESFFVLFFPIFLRKGKCFYAISLSSTIY
jgi:hypothetical protein